MLECLLLSLRLFLGLHLEEMLVLRVCGLGAVIKGVVAQLLQLFGLPCYPLLVLFGHLDVWRFLFLSGFLPGLA